LGAAINGGEDDLGAIGRDGGGLTTLLLALALFPKKFKTWFEGSCKRRKMDFFPLGFEHTAST
jgi:hypothetical protein